MSKFELLAIMTTILQGTYFLGVGLDTSICIDVAEEILRNLEKRGYKADV